MTRALNAVVVMFAIAIPSVARAQQECSCGGTLTMCPTEYSCDVCCCAVAGGSQEQCTGGGGGGGGGETWGGGGGGGGPDPAWVEEQRRLEAAAEAAAAAERAAAYERYERQARNREALSSRGRELEAEVDAFRRAFDGAGDATVHAGGGGSPRPAGDPATPAPRPQPPQSDSLPIVLLSPPTKQRGFRVVEPPPPAPASGTAEPNRSFSDLLARIAVPDTSAICGGATSHGPVPEEAVQAACRHTHDALVDAARTAMRDRLEQRFPMLRRLRTLQEQLTALPAQAPPHLRIAVELMAVNDRTVHALSEIRSELACLGSASTTCQTPLMDTLLQRRAEDHEETTRRLWP